MAFDNRSATGAGQARYEEVIARLVHLEAEANSFERPFLAHKALERRQLRRALEAAIIGAASPAELPPRPGTMRAWRNAAAHAKSPLSTRPAAIASTRAAAFAGTLVPPTALTAE